MRTDPAAPGRLTVAVAVTGPTGELGRSFVRALEQTDEVDRVLAMARREFDPAEFDWRKTEYRQGDISDRAAVDALVADADVVVHLAFVVVQASSASEDVNIEGSRNVFDAAVAAGVPRLVYTSSVAAYGYNDVGEPLREDMPTHGTDAHAYSRHKAAVETVLRESLAEADATAAWVFRPCIVAGHDAPTLLEIVPYLSIADRLPDTVTTALGKVPGLHPVLPDHGIAFQLVHHDDVAQALVAAVLGRGAPGVYNLAGDGEVSISDLATALGWYSAPVPRLTMDIGAKALARAPGMSVAAGWLEALRSPMSMDTTRARTELGWSPAYTAEQTLADLVADRR